MSNDRRETVARALFDARPHNNPAGAPAWGAQPDGIKAVFYRDADVAIAAIPAAGIVTTEMLERAARARGDVIARRNRVNLPWEALPERWRVEIIEDMRAIFESIGLQVAGSSAKAAP